MKKLLYILIVLLSGLNTFGQSDNEKAIRNVLAKQQADWNAGNIPAFMEGYWKSDSLTFVGGNGPTYGWQNTLANYKKRYPDLATMGQLKFDILTVNVFDGKTAHLVGKWALTRPQKGDIGGYFSLVFRKINGQWLIISDHTS